MPDPLNSPDPLLSATSPAGVVILALSPPGEFPIPDTHTPREYDCIFMTPGLVDAADGTKSNWLIPPLTIQEAAPLFEGVGVYLDHPALFGFGWRGDPGVKHPARVTPSMNHTDTSPVATNCHTMSVTPSRL